MFSPEGYSSFLRASRLIREYHSNYDLDFSPLFKVAFEDDEGEFSKVRALEYSENEVLERAFFQLIQDFETFICRSDGTLLRVDVPFWLNLFNFRQLKRMPGFDTDYFDKYLDWPSYEAFVEARLQEKKDPWEKSFLEFPCTSVNLFYNRDNFLIDCKEYWQLDGAVQYGLHLEGEGYPFKIDSVREFEGWSLCLREEDVAKIEIESVREVVFKIMFEAVFGNGALEEYRPTSTTQMALGRPRVRQHAAEAFLKHFTIDSKPDWKTVQRILLEKEGLEVSPKTIKRGLSELDQ